MLLFCHLLRLSRPPFSARFLCFLPFFFSLACCARSTIYIDLYQTPKTPACTQFRLSQSSAALFILLDQSRQRLSFFSLFVLLLLFFSSRFFFSFNVSPRALLYVFFHHRRSQPVRYCLTTRSNCASDGVRHVASSFSSLLSLFSSSFSLGF